MSPTSSSSSSIYDHLMINFPQQPKLVMRNTGNSSMNIYDNSRKLLSSNSTTNMQNPLLIKKTQSLPLDEQQRARRRFTITHISIPEPVTRCAVSNQAYEKAIPRKSLPIPDVLSTWKEPNPNSSATTNPKYIQKPLTSNIEVKPMDFRPLIINGRRRFTTISSASPMVIIKKKSPSPSMNTISFGQKPSSRSIPVNITSSNTAMVVSTVIPSALSYSSSSCCCSSSTTSTSSTNVGTVSVPIQVIKTQKNNNNCISTSTTTTSTNTSIEGQRGYRYIPKQSQSQSQRAFFNLKAGNQVQPLPILSDDDDDSTKVPSSSSISADGNSYYSTTMTDSHVLRLIRRYDPVAAEAIGIRHRHSLENTRNAPEVSSTKSVPSIPNNISSSCSYLPQQTSVPIYEDNRSIRQASATPRLRRQQAIHEQDLSPTNVTASIQPILKYTAPTSRIEGNLQAKTLEPLSIEIEQPVPPPITNENATIYQPLITTGTKRVCAAISKSEWNLRLQQDPPPPIVPPQTLPIQAPSPPKIVDSPPPPPPPAKKESYRPLLSRTRSVMEVEDQNGADNDQDKFDENSAPVTIGSCVGRLKQLFNAKTSLDPTSPRMTKQNRMSSIDSNLDRHSYPNEINLTKSDLLPSNTAINQKSANSIESIVPSLSNSNSIKPVSLIQETTAATTSPSLKRPILKSQKTIDGTESTHRLNHSQTMPSSDLSYDTYRFRRLNDSDQQMSSATRLRNVAKVEPYLINTNTVRPLYQSSSIAQSIPATTPPPPPPQAQAKTRIILNSTGNTPTNSSTSSSAASLGGTIRHPNILHSDFLMPNPSYSTTSQPASHTSQTLSNSSSYATPPSTLLSESLSQGSMQRFSNNMNNNLSHNGRSTGLINSSQKYQSQPAQGDFHSSKQPYSLSTHPISNGTAINNNNGNQYKKFDNYTPPNSYHYRPKEFASSSTAINASSPLINGRPQSQGSMRSTTLEHYQPPPPPPLPSSMQDDRSNAGQQQSRRRFQRRKQMKRSKSADLYQEPTSIPSKNSKNDPYLFNPTNNNELNRHPRPPRSISRDLINEGRGDGNLSSSSTSSSSIANMERVNQAVLSRYKSLDSMTFHNKKSNPTGNPNNRRTSSRPIHADLDSDDSVCGIPKSRKLCSSSRNVTKSERTLLDSSSTERDRPISARAFSIHDIGTTGTTTGITNSIYKNSINDEQADVWLDSSPSIQLSLTKTTNGKGAEGDIMQREQQSGPSLAETQFYARTTPTPVSKRHALIFQKSEEIYSTPPLEPTFQDSIDHYKTNQDRFIDEQNMPTKIYSDWSSPYDNEYTQNQELFITEPTDVNPQAKSALEKKKFPNSFERLRSFERFNEKSNTTIIPPLVRPLKSSIDKMHREFDDNDSSTSTTNRSVHLPVEKQRGQSEIIRKRNSRFKVEDYKRSFQRSNTCDEQSSDYYRPLSNSISDYTLSNNQTSTTTDVSPRQRLSKTKSINMPLEVNQPTETMLNENDEIKEKMTVAAKKNLFETFNKNTPVSRGLTRSKSFKQDSSSSFMKTIDSYPSTKIEINSKEENQVPSDDNCLEKNVEIFDDATSKLSFKEKMTLFNKKKHLGSGPSSTLKTNRNRLTQPITAEEVQAAESLSAEPSPASSTKQLTIPIPVNATLLMHEPSLLNNETLCPVRFILQTSTLEENRVDQENVQDLTVRNNTEETSMLSPEEAENMIPVSKRLEQLKTYGENEWKKRVKTTNDANEFTVEGKLRQAGKIPTPSDESKPIPTSTRKTPTLKYAAKKSNIDQDQRAKTVDVVRLKTESTIKTKDTLQTSSNGKTNGTTSTKANNRNNIVSVVQSDTVSVLKPDDHLDDFFADTNKNLDKESSVQLNTDDLNRIAKNAVRLQAQPARVRPPRRQQQGAKNPLRQIQATIPTSNEYTEVHTNLSEQELRRLKRAQIAENAGLAQEALAALAATENFAEINLRKIDRSSVATFGFEPYKDLMLILIKGRRHCSLRLLNPTTHSINEGDCYLLITPSKVFAWLGRYANALEKAKTMDILDYLKQHRDFGLRSEAKYFAFDQANDDIENDIHAEFVDILRGEHEHFKTIDYVTDDDFYEANIMELNRVYRVDNDTLIPLDDFCFRSLSVKILDANDVFVFDFGSELYVWNGKYADKIKRNMGLQLAQQLWSDPYDFSECLINPFDPLDEKNESSNQTGTKRPSWSIFGKQNQNVETLLFKGKFYDWPGDLKELKPVHDAANNVHRIPSARRPPSIVETLKPADVKQMLTKKDNPVNMILEQANLGRGKHWYDPIELRGHDVQTISLNVWHVYENERHEIALSSYGQFHSDDVYIIRWRYKLVASGFHSIKTGQASVRKTDTGRDRVAYWIWQGINASPNEKGLSALMTVFLDEEKGPHIHVIQEHEEATFLQLFDGTFTIHLGKRNPTKPNKSPWHLYVFLGEIEVENHWWELNIDSSNLRSRTSFLLINNLDNIMLLWHGCQTTDEQKVLAKKSATKLRDRCAEEFHFSTNIDNIEFVEMQEGEEIDLFWNAVNERTHQRKYNSLLNARSNEKLTATMRIFHLSSLHGPFVAQELVYLLRSPDHISAFPFTQADLYDLPQPALCLIDAETELYIWQGWNDLTDDELEVQLSNANVQAGSPRDMRFTAERRCAFLTAVEYCKAKTGSSTVELPCSIIYAGLEPIDFINRFPKWTIHTKARQQNQLEGKKVNQKDSVPDILKQLCREQYTLDELRARPLPEGVDPSKIEFYLSDDDFQKEFRMSKDEFYALPYWKQTNIKKPLGFF